MCFSDQESAEANTSNPSATTHEQSFNQSVIEIVTDSSTDQSCDTQAAILSASPVGPVTPPANGTDGGERNYLS